MIRLGVALTRDVGDGKFERASQFATDPVQGIEAWATAGILALHLADDHLGVRINMQRPRFERLGILQGFEKGYVFRYVVVLATNPAGDANGAAGATLDHDANTGRPRVSQRPAIDVGHEV